MKIIVFFLTVAIWTAAGYFIGSAQRCSREAMKAIHICTFASAR